jgi:DNA-directed RNA polymerase subunit omega
MLPSPDILNDYPHGRFVLSNLAAKRARQLREGAMPLVQIDSHHPLTIALAEIAAGKIKPIISEAIVNEFDTNEMTLLTDETLPAELGMLLPALDETEVALVQEILAEHGDDHDDNHDAPVEKVMSLTDLVEGHDDEEEEVVPVASEDDTLSLSDIAEQESADEEESEA